MITNFPKHKAFSSSDDDENNLDERNKKPKEVHQKSLSCYPKSNSLKFVKLCKRKSLKRFEEVVVEKLFENDQKG